MKRMRNVSSDIVENSRIFKHPRTMMPIRRLSSGKAHLYMLQELIKEAKDSILISSYGVSSNTLCCTDFFKATLYDLLAEACKRGVKIYIYDIDKKGRLDNYTDNFFKKHDICYVKTYTHAKILAVDKKFVAIGSYNWLSTAGGKFQDSVNGSIYIEESEICEIIKETFWQDLKYYRNLQQYGNKQQINENNSNPDDEKTVVWNLEEEFFEPTRVSYIRSLNGHRAFIREVFTIAKNRIIFCSPFVYQDSFQEDFSPKMLAKATNRGVNVFLICLPNHELKLRQSIGTLVKCHRIHLITRENFHLKTVIIDDNIIAEGSFNWFSATRDRDRENQEVTITYQGPSLKRFMGSRYIDDFAKSMKLDLDLTSTTIPRKVNNRLFEPKRRRNLPRTGQASCSIGPQGDYRYHKTNPSSDVTPTTFASLQSHGPALVTRVMTFSGTIDVDRYHRALTQTLDLHDYLFYHADTMPSGELQLGVTDIIATVTTTDGSVSNQPLQRVTPPPGALAYFQLTSGGNEFTITSHLSHAFLDQQGAVTFFECLSNFYLHPHDTVQNTRPLLLDGTYILHDRPLDTGEVQIPRLSYGSLQLVSHSLTPTEQTRVARTNAIVLSHYDGTYQLAYSKAGTCEIETLDKPIHQTIIQAAQFTDFNGRLSVAHHLEFPINQMLAELGASNRVVSERRYELPSEAFGVHKPVGKAVERTVPLISQTADTHILLRLTYDASRFKDLIEESESYLSWNDILHAIVMKIHAQQSTLRDDDNVHLTFHCEFRRRLGLPQNTIGNFIARLGFCVKASFAKNASILALAQYNRKFITKIQPEHFESSYRCSRSDAYPNVPTYYALDKHCHELLDDPQRWIHLNNHSSLKYEKIQFEEAQLMKYQGLPGIYKIVENDKLWIKPGDLRLLTLTNNTTDGLLRCEKTWHPQIAAFGDSTSLFQTSLVEEYADLIRTTTSSEAPTYSL